MGSEYTVFENDDAAIRLSEMSNKFDLTVDGSADEIEQGYGTVVRGLSPEQLVEIAFRFIQTAAYWDDGEKLRELIEEKLAAVVFSDAGEE